MASLWKLGGLSWRELGKRVWSEIQEDNVFGRAAELSYYFLLALFPFLIFLTSVIGLILGSGTGTRHALFDYLGRIMPPSAYQLISTTRCRKSRLLAVAANCRSEFSPRCGRRRMGMSAITQTLNTAYDLKESRPWWKQRLAAMGLTIALSVSDHPGAGVDCSWWTYCRVARESLTDLVRFSRWLGRLFSGRWCLRA